MAEEIPSRDDTLRHVIQARLRDRAVLDEAADEDDGEYRAFEVKVEKAGVGWLESNWLRLGFGFKVRIRLRPWARYGIGIRPGRKRQTLFYTCITSTRAISFPG